MIFKIEIISKQNSLFLYFFYEMLTAETFETHYYVYNGYMHSFTNKKNTAQRKSTYIQDRQYPFQHILIHCAFCAERIHKTNPFIGQEVALSDAESGRPSGAEVRVLSLASQQEETQQRQQPQAGSPPTAHAP